MCDCACSSERELVQDIKERSSLEGKLVPRKRGSARVVKGRVGK